MEDGDRQGGVIVECNSGENRKTKGEELSERTF